MLLSIKNFSVQVATPTGDKVLVQDANLDIGLRRVVGLVGGSGSGKTTTAMGILRLLSSPLSVTAGKILFEGEDLLTLPEDKMRKVRGQQIAMVFQDPLYALNPVLTIGAQTDEVLRYHTKLNAKERQERIAELFKKVGMTDSRRIALSYPHQLSGGMRQRAMIAQAIALNPKLIIADEPTSNLDVTVQARIIELFQKLKDDLGISILLITHDLGLVRYLADDVYVMKEGRIIESGSAKAVLSSPRQEYTQQLLEASR